MPKNIFVLLHFKGHNFCHTLTAGPQFTFMGQAGQYRRNNWVVISENHCTALHRTAPHRTAPHRTAPHRTAVERKMQAAPIFP